MTDSRNDKTVYLDNVGLGSDEGRGRQGEGRRVEYTYQMKGEDECRRGREGPLNANLPGHIIFISSPLMYQLIVSTSRPFLLACAGIDRTKPILNLEEDGGLGGKLTRCRKCYKD